jgi:hypothetical protein
MGVINLYFWIYHGYVNRSCFLLLSLCFDAFVPLPLWKFWIRNLVRFKEYSFGWCQTLFEKKVLTLQLPSPFITPHIISKRKNFKFRQVIFNKLRKTKSIPFYPFQLMASTRSNLEQDSVVWLGLSKAGMVFCEGKLKNKFWYALFS